MTVDDDGLCRLTHDPEKATRMIEEVNLLGYIYYYVADGRWQNYYLSVGEDLYLGVGFPPPETWGFNHKANMVCMQSDIDDVEGVPVGYFCQKEEGEDERSPHEANMFPQGYLILSAGARPCMVARDLVPVGGLPPRPHPPYLAYQSPFQQIGYAVDQNAYNPMAIQAAQDFRSAERGYPFASRQLSMKRSSAFPPAPPFMQDGAVHPWMLPFLRPGIRYPGVADTGSHFGPLGMGLANERQGPNGAPNMIVALEPNGAAQRAGAQVGDIVIEIVFDQTELDPWQDQILQSPSQRSSTNGTMPHQKTEKYSNTSHERIVP